MTPDSIAEEIEIYMNNSCTIEKAREFVKELVCFLESEFPEPEKKEDRNRPTQNFSFDVGDPEVLAYRVQGFIVSVSPDNPNRPVRFSIWRVEGGRDTLLPVEGKKWAGSVCELNMASPLSREDYHPSQFVPTHVILLIEGRIQKVLEGP